MRFERDDGGREAAGFKGEAGDCVTRAIAIAAGKPYAEVYGSLAVLCTMERYRKREGRSSPRTGVGRRTYHDYILSLGFRWVPCMGIGSGCKVHLTDGELPTGRLVVRLSRHLAAVIDGVLRDTHDCSRDGTRCVYGYYVKEG